MRGTDASVLFLNRESLKMSRNNLGELRVEFPGGDLYPFRFLLGSLGHDMPFAS